MRGITCFFVPSVSGDSVATATDQKVDKDEDTASIADSALGTASVSGATFTGTHFSEVSCLIEMM